MKLIIEIIKLFEDGLSYLFALLIFFVAGVPFLSIENPNTAERPRTLT
jgi:hypothetical protein